MVDRLSRADVDRDALRRVRDLVSPAIRLRLVLVGDGPYVVVHPGASVPARQRPCAW